MAVSSRNTASSSPRISGSRSSRRRVNSRPMTEAIWSARLGSSARRSMRAAMTSWMVSGTWIRSTGAASTNRPFVASTAPVSRSERTISSTKNGLPSAFWAISCGQRPGQSGRLEHVLGHPRAVLVGQGAEGDARDEGSIAEREGVAGAIREDEEHADARHAVHQGGEELLGRGVDPVQVLDDHDLGRVAAALARRRRRASSVSPRRCCGSIVGTAGSPGIDGEQSPQVRRRSRRLPRRGRRTPRSIFGRSSRRRVALLDPEDASQQIDQRVEGHRAPEGEAAALEPSRAVADPARNSCRSRDLPMPGSPTMKHHLALARLGAARSNPRGAAARARARRRASARARPRRRAGCAPREAPGPPTRDTGSALPLSESSPRARVSK